MVCLFSENVRWISVGQDLEVDPRWKLVTKKKISTT